MPATCCHQFLAPALAVALCLSVYPAGPLAFRLHFAGNNILGKKNLSPHHSLSIPEFRKPRVSSNHICFRFVSLKPKLEVF